MGFLNKNGSKKKRNSKRRHHAHTVEDNDPPRKRVKQESEDEYVLISALMGTVTHGSKDWLIDSVLQLQQFPKILKNFRALL